jgi:broad specificity phosphatase PhoE
VTDQTPELKREVLCVRHGLTEWNAVFRWQGRANIGLTEEGIEQAKRAGAALAQITPAFDTLICSPLIRARTTAEVIGDGLGLEVAAMDDRWMERDIGEWSGFTTTEIEQRWPGMLEQWRNASIDQLPGGEKEADMTQRVCAALVDVLQSPTPRRTVVVTHGGVLHTLRAAYGLASRPFGNLEGQWFGWDGERVTPGGAVTLDPSALLGRNNAL